MRKLSLHENLRHRLHDSLKPSKSRKVQRKLRRKFKKDVQPVLRKSVDRLPHFRRQPDHSTAQSVLFLTVGIVAGVVTGVALAQRYGGFKAITERMRSRFGEHERDSDDREHFYSHSDEGGDLDDFSAEQDELSPMEELEERVLETYRNDPILSQRAIDIGAMEEGVIELTGWVHEASEATHAVTVAGGTPGVLTVVNRLAIRDEEDQIDEFSDFNAPDDEDNLQWNTEIDIEVSGRDDSSTPPPRGD